MRKGLYYSMISIILLQNNNVFGLELNKSNDEKVLELQISEDIDGLNTIIPVFEKERAVKISKPYFKIYPNYTEHLIGRAMVYFPTIESALNKYDLPEDLKYIPFFESGFRPDVVSSAGATGLWQFMKYTAINNGLIVNSEIDERLDYEKSSEAAAMYLKELFDEFQDWTLTLMAYNAGPYRVKKVLKTVDRNNITEIIKRMPSETRVYLSKLIAAKLIFSSYKSYNIIPEMPTAKELHLKTIVVDKGFNLNKLAQQYNVKASDLASFNPHVKQYSIANSKMNSINIRIPISSVDDSNEEYFQIKQHYFSNLEELKQVANKMDINFRHILLANEYFSKFTFAQGLLTFNIPQDQYMEIMQIIGPQTMPEILSPMITVRGSEREFNSKLESKRLTTNVTNATFQYFLQPKETLMDVASKFKISIEKILELNPTINSNFIQSLVIPTTSFDVVQL